jgi:hypothetical protein
MQILLVLTILGGQSHASKTNRLKHLGIFWGMSPMNLFLQEERYLSSRLAPDSINRSQEKLLTLKKTTIYIYIYQLHIYVRRTRWSLVTKLPTLC